MSTRAYTPYAAYKDSGVEWLGQIPAEWEVKRADAFLSNVKRQVEPSTLSAELVFHYSIPSIQATGDGQLEAPSTIDSAKLAITGQLLLVSKLNPRKGVVLIASEKDVPTVASTEFVPFETKGCDLRWALYLSLAESTRQRLSATVRSATRSHQRAEVADITKVWHAVPSLPEQRAIATFLDRETAQIDALVATKERLITLLQERRTALITRAITKGLDPAAPMKDSGVEWLGEIPAHWEVRPLKHLTSFTTGWTPPTGREDYYGGEHFWANIGDLGPKYLSATEKTVTDSAVREARLRIVPKGSLLFSFKLSVGAVSLTTVDMYTNEAIAAFEPSERIDTGYLYWAAPVLVTRNAQENIYGAPLLSRERIANAHVLSPPLVEQRVIAAKLDAEALRTDELVDRIREAINRLHELRTALIAAAVTGRIDVREAAQ